MQVAMPNPPPGFFLLPTLDELPRVQCPTSCMRYAMWPAPFPAFAPLEDTHFAFASKAGCLETPWSRKIETDQHIAPRKSSRPPPRL